jgi:hypothetical protein
MTMPPLMWKIAGWLLLLDAVMYGIIGWVNLFVHPPIGPTFPSPLLFAVVGLLCFRTAKADAV